MNLNNKKDIKVAFYMRVGNIEQLDHYIKEEKDDENDNNMVGLYIRSGLQDGDEVNSDIYSQESKLEKYCKENNILNRTLYIDVRKSGRSDERIAYKQMIEDINEGIINKVIITSLSKLSRSHKQLIDFADVVGGNKIEVFALDVGKLDFDFSAKLVNEHLKKEIEEYTENKDEIEF